MSKTIKIKKGLNIKLVGEASREITDIPLPESVAIKPPDFTGVTPKMLVKEGDEVLAGTPIFYDKDHEEIRFSSPVSGEIAGIVRGEKRKILEVRILCDRELNYVSFPVQEASLHTKESATDILLQSGVWPVIRQRPFGIIARPDQHPKSIFISAFDTHPLAPDLDFIMKDQGAEFQFGLDILKKLTTGDVHLSIHENTAAESVFKKAKGVTIHVFSGPHPSGNVGTQIHHIDPVNKGELVWCVNPQDVAVIGKLFSKGIYDASRVIAITGSRIQNPSYYKTITGTNVNAILNDCGLKEGNNRIISGNVLTGKRISRDGYLGFYDAQITAIPEGEEPEFMGWLKPGLEKLSLSRAYFSWLRPDKKYDLNTNLHGEERPFVMSGQYENVFPMDLYPVQLLKSILVDDIEMMEKLGIYEVVEEDFALCEFVCTSKIESQHIIRKGLDLVKKELG